MGSIVNIIKTHVQSFNKKYSIHCNNLKIFQIKNDEKMATTMILFCNSPCTNCVFYILWEVGEMLKACG
jgi:hypothetical protein